MRLSEDVHTLAYQLHPSILEELGLAEALRAECERRRRQTELDVSAAVGDVPKDLSDDAALCLFRVAQESLNNVVNHARATAVGVRLRRRDDGILLTVSDDGAGFDVHRRGSTAHLGLAGMRERVRLVNGTLSIESAPDEGTTVTAWVPVQGRRTEDE
jgi:signal transduction histidine kinase